MLKWIESTGKSEEAAIEAALQKLGMDRDEVSVEILARRSVNTPAYPRRTPHGAPAPRGPRFPFICRGGVNPPRHRGFGGAKTLGRARGAGASSALHLVGVQQNGHRPVVL